MQHILEENIGLALISEPYQTTGNGFWITDNSGLAAIFISPNYNLEWKKIIQKDGYVIMKTQDAVLVSCYFSPNRPLEEFESFLLVLQLNVQPFISGYLIIAGDFNARSSAWQDTTTCPRGNLLASWMEAFGLILLNQGNDPTCVHYQGNSIVDTSWVSRSLYRRGITWFLDLEYVTHSDHRLISMDLLSSCKLKPLDRSPRIHQGWCLNQLNIEKLKEALICTSWSIIPANSSASLLADQLNKLTRTSCDYAMPHKPNSYRKSSVYWWNNEIADIRRKCISLRRDISHYKYTRQAPTLLLEEFRQTKSILRRTICKAKGNAWQNLIDDINKDPWEKAYRVITKRFKFPNSPNPLITLEVNELNNILGELSPKGSGVILTPESRRQHKEDINILKINIAAAIRRSSMKNSAPGPDGVPNKLLSIIYESIPCLIEDCIKTCLEEGSFPECWKKAHLVLLPKPNKSTTSASAFRPICLLDGFGKVLERVILTRLMSHIESRVFGKNLSYLQFGFRAGRSTSDALRTLRALIEEDTSNGKYCLITSIDIKNAFNSIPHSEILRALLNRKFPVYLQKIIASFLSNRSFFFLRGNGEVISNRITCGVPQGSVLSPFLWNITYDAVLQADLPFSAKVIGYADDTLILVSSSNPESVKSKAEYVISYIITILDSLGLTVAYNKTEALLFAGHYRNRTPQKISINIRGLQITSSPTIKYLGFYLDSKWSFKEHIIGVSQKAERILVALSRLMPNIGGPRETRRRLFTTVIRSIILYGASIWAREGVLSSRVRILPLIRIQRRLDQRSICAYRTVSGTAAGLIASSPPIDLLAKSYNWRYEKLYELRHAGQRSTSQRQTTISPAVKKAVITESHAALMSEWKSRLLRMNTLEPGFRARTLLMPIFYLWTTRNFGSVDYRLCQFLSGHGCCVSFLYKIRKIDSPECPHCYDDFDNVQHTFYECCFWSYERQLFQTAIEFSSLSDEMVISHLIKNKLNWLAVTTFIGRILKKKEAAERKRQRLSEP